jgi:F420-dependent oxidoreductase-like protein
MVNLLELGLSLTGSGGPRQMVERAVLAEQRGIDSVWTSEGWGNDAFTPLAAIAERTTRIGLGTGIAQVGTRSPGAMTMTALTLQELSAGRLRIGLGVSGPQVIEGWHGLPFTKPLLATREYVTILRSGLAADQRVEFDGVIYQVPYRGEGATGLGRALRSTLPGWPQTPILIAAIGPKNVSLAVEIADGLLPYLWSPTHWSKAWGKSLAEVPTDFQIAPTVFVSMGDDLAHCRDAVRPRIALHVGGMGSRERNFYKDLLVAYGYEEEAQIIQDLFLAGDRAGATAAVPDHLVDELSLIGGHEAVKDRLDAWREGPVTTIIAEPMNEGSFTMLLETWGQ